MVVDRKISARLEGDEAITPSGLSWCRSCPGHRVLLPRSATCLASPTPPARAHGAASSSATASRTPRSPWPHRKMGAALVGWAVIEAVTQATARWCCAALALWRRARGYKIGRVAAARKLFTLVDDGLARR